MNASKYHKTATREVRPFFGIATLTEALSDAQIRLYDDQPFVGDTSFTVEERDIPRLNIAVRPNLSAAHLSGGSSENLVLAVTAVNPFLKRTEMIRKAPLADIGREDIILESDAIERLGGGSNVTIEIALCLAEASKRQPGKPFMQGHWISKKAFELRGPKLSEEFDVEAMDDEGWKAMGYPPKTLYHVDYYNGINEPAQRDRPIARIRIHSDVYKKLASDNVPKLSRPIMAFLASEIPCQVLAASLSEWKDAEQPEARSPLSAFLKRINRVQPCSLADLRGLVEEPGMRKLRAVLHTDQETVRRVAEV